MADIVIRDLLQQSDAPLLSFEFFPPKDGAGLDNLRRVAKQLLAARPDFATCTYGAGGSTQQKTLQVCRLLQDVGYGPVMPHLTCVGSSREELKAMTDDLRRLGYRNVMTLRGDPPKGDSAFRPAPDGLAHASELVALLKARHPDFCCGVAAYPETHPEAASAESDIEYLQQKLDAGADFATTQLFFDNRVYYDFVKRCRAAGITKPIVPGLLPAISLKQVQRMCAMCKASLPPDLGAAMERAGGEGEAAEAAGRQWAVQQIEELISSGVPGIHLYVLNRAGAALSPELLDCLGRHRPPES
jgi:methylenetetrahydrofolate reductase (NADPH)